MLNKKIYILCFAIYLGLSPIYWIPYVSPFYFEILKSSLFVYIVIFGVLFSIKNMNNFKLKFPGGGFVFYTLIVMFFVVLPYYFKGDNKNNFITLINLLQIILFLIASRVVLHYGKVYFVIKYSLIVLSFFVILSVFLMLLMPFVTNPFNDKLHLFQTGFGGARTGWSPSIGLFIPFILMFSSSFLLLFVYLFSQMITGGRAGFYLSVLAVPIMLSLEKTWRIYLRFMFFIIVIFLILYIYNPSYFDSFRVFESLKGSESLEDFSSGRGVRLQAAWFSIFNSPFLGNAMHASFEGDNVHNVFIKGWVYYGFIYFVSSILIVFYIFLKWLKKFKNSNLTDKDFLIILLIILSTGVLAGMVEPSIIFGNFTTFSIWWFSFALVSSKDCLIVKDKVKI